MAIVEALQAVAGTTLKGSQFGIKGMMAGAGLGLATFGASNAIESHGRDENGDDTVKGKMGAGFLLGSIGSATSTGIEMYSMKHQNSIIALDTMERFGDAQSHVKVTDNILTGKFFKNVFKDTAEANKNTEGTMNKVKNFANSTIKNFTGAQMNPENVMTDITKASMFTNKGEHRALFDTTIGPVIGDVEGFGDRMKKSILNAPKVLKDTFVGNTFGVAQAFDKNDSEWLSTDASKLKHGITPNMSAGERAAKYVETYKDDYNSMIDQMQKNTKTDSKIKNADDLMDYFKSYEAGPSGKHEAFYKAGIYGKNSNFARRAVGTFEETMEGSPMYARTLKYQKNKNQYRDGKLSKMATLEKTVGKDGTEEVKVASGKAAKAMRGVALGADVLTGGVLMAGAYGAAFEAHKLMHRKRFNTNNISSNNAVDEI